MLEVLADEFSIEWSMSWTVMSVRLIGSVLLCGLIGYERELRSRPAGLRTHMLVGMAATVYTLIMLYLIDVVADFEDSVGIDPSRILQAITGGVAFLAAGVVVFAKGKVRGLTTGASMWLAAAVGTAIGMGLWPIAIMTTAMAVVIIVALRHFEDEVINGQD